MGLMKKLAKESSDSQTLFPKLQRRFSDLSMVKRMNDLYDESSENENLLDVMVPYADLMTLLLVFFVFFYIISDFKKNEMIQEQQKKMEEIIKLQAETDLNEKVITIPGEVLFESGEADLKFNSLRTLSQIAEDIKEEMGGEPDWQIRIEGHTDDVPIFNEDFASNWELSTARALSVVKFFMENNFFPPDQMQAMGYGEFKPIVPNDTPAHKKKNRRVELRLSKKYQ